MLRYLRTLLEGIILCEISRQRKTKTAYFHLHVEFKNNNNKTNEQIQQNRNRFIDAEYELWLPEAWDGMREILRGTHFQL